MRTPWLFNSISRRFKKDTASTFNHETILCKPTVVTTTRIIYSHIHGIPYFYYLLNHIIYLRFLNILFSTTRNLHSHICSSVYFYPTLYRHYPRVFLRETVILNSDMASQSFITSFFTKADNSFENSTKIDDDNELAADRNIESLVSDTANDDHSPPVKQSKKKLVRNRIESSSDDDDYNNKTTPVVKTKKESPALGTKNVTTAKKETKKRKSSDKGSAKKSAKKSRVEIDNQENKTQVGDGVTDNSRKTEDVKATAAEEKDVSEKKMKPKETSEDKKSQSNKTMMFFGKVESKTNRVDDKYDPTRSNYDPIEHAIWGADEAVPYRALADTLNHIEATSARLKIVDTLANFYRSVIALSPDDFIKCVYLSLNKIAPAWEGRELGVGESFLIKAISQTTGKSADRIKTDMAALGDLGSVAETARANQRTMIQPAALTVSKVFGVFREVSNMVGVSSTQKKIDKIKGLLVACRTGVEAKYLIRSLTGKLRIGLAEQSVLSAISQAVVLTPPAGRRGVVKVTDSVKKEIAEADLEIKTRYCELPSYDVVLERLLSRGWAALDCGLTPGIPLKPMLAHPTKGIGEVFKRFEDTSAFTCEWKYDGERAQIHVERIGTGGGEGVGTGGETGVGTGEGNRIGTGGETGVGTGEETGIGTGGETGDERASSPQLEAVDSLRVRVFSRNQEDNSSKYPDVAARLPAVLRGHGVNSCVIDTEAVAWDPESRKILPFQVLSTRKRRDAQLDEVRVQVCVYAFDLLYLNGESLVKQPLRIRRQKLRENFNEIEGQFVFATSMDSSNADDIAEFLEESIKGNCEGLMVKTLDVSASYEIAKRSHNWLKLKKDYLDGVGDTLDLVVIGGYLGRGKRTGGYGGFLLACYDEENEEFQTICKIGTGFKDEDLERHSSFFPEHVLEEPRPYYRYSASHPAPDHWFDCVQVWEVKCADLSVSPVHSAAVGIVDPVKGISLRFPRFLRVRDDKKPEEATSSRRVAEFYRNQDQVKNQQDKPPVLDEDFY